MERGWERGGCACRVPVFCDALAHHRFQLVDIRADARTDVQAGERLGPHLLDGAGQGDHIGPGYVRAVDIVADVAAVTVDRSSLPGQQFLAKDRHHSRLAVRILPRTKHIRIAQRQSLKAVLLGKESQIPLADPLGDAVRAHGIGRR